MILVPLALALALARSGTLDADFPDATVTRDAGRIVRITGLSVPPRANASRVASAVAFLRRYQDELALRGQALAVERDAAAGRVRLSRSARGIPIANADLVVGFDRAGRLVSVSAATIPGPLTGRFALRPRGAVASARAAIRGGATAKLAGTSRAWFPTGEATRAAWRVDLTTASPTGAWRVYVDATDGKVLFTEDCQVTGGR